MSAELDLGYNHVFRFYSYHPADRDSVERAGAIDEHLAPDGKPCEGGVTFDVPGTENLRGPKWQIVSWEPLTLSPSLRCTTCGDHGFVRNGKWVPA